MAAASTSKTLSTQYNLDDSDPSETQLTDDAIAEVQKSVLEQNKYNLVPTDMRNVLFLGKTRSGKSTAVSVLQNPVVSPNEASIFSGTTGAKFHSFSIKCGDPKDGGKDKYSVSVIDTPGLFEVKRQGEESRTLDVIIDVITKCLEMEITKLHCVVMFTCYQTGIAKDDVDAITIFANLFGAKVLAAPREEKGGTRTKDKNASPPDATPADCRMALCFTHAENLEQSKQQTHIKELNDHPQLGPVIKANDIKIFFLGCVSAKALTYRDRQHLFEAYRRVYKMRTVLLDFIFTSVKPKRLAELEVMQKKNNEIMTNFQQLIDSFPIFQGFKTPNEYTLPTVKNQIAKHKELIQSVKGFDRTYFTMSTLSDVFVRVHKAAKAFVETEHVPVEVRRELCWPLTPNDVIQSKSLLRTFFSFENA